MSSGAQRVEDGNQFSASHIFEAVADNGTATVWIDTGATTLGMTYDISAGGDAYVRLRESVNMGTAVGTPLTAFNHNRNDSNTVDATIYHSPTYTSGGTIIEEAFIAGGQKGFASGGGESADHSWIIDIGHNYSVDVVNKGGGDKAISIDINLYEDN